MYMRASLSPLLLLLKEIIFLALSYKLPNLILRFWMRLQPWHLECVIVLRTCQKGGSGVHWDVMGVIVSGRRGYLFLKATRYLLIGVNCWRLAWRSSGRSITRRTSRRGRGRGGLGSCVIQKKEREERGKWVSGMQVTYLYHHLSPTVSLRSSICCSTQGFLRCVPPGLCSAPNTSDWEVSLGFIRRREIKGFPFSTNWVNEAGREREYLC